MWSPLPTEDGGYKIAYADTATPNDINYDIYLVDPETKTSFNLTRSSNVNEAQATWSPDATRIAIYHGRENNTNAPYDVEILTLGTTPCLPDQSLCEIAPRQSLVQDIIGSPLLIADTIGNLTWANSENEVAVTALIPPDGNGDIWKNFCRRSPTPSERNRDQQDQSSRSRRDRPVMVTRRHTNHPSSVR